MKKPAIYTNRRIIIEAEMDNMGGVILRPRSKRVRRQMERHNLEWHKRPDDSVYLQREDDIESFKDNNLSPLQQRELDQGYPVAVRMDAWEFGNYVGYDFHEVIRP